MTGCAMIAGARTRCVDWSCVGAQQDVDETGDRVSEPSMDLGVDGSSVRTMLSVEDNGGGDIGTLTETDDRSSWSAIKREVEKTSRVGGWNEAGDFERSTLSNGGKIAFSRLLSLVAGAIFLGRDGLFARVARGHGPGQISEAEECLVVWLVDTESFEVGSP